MQEITRKYRRLAWLFMVMMLALSIGVVSVSAQGIQPTATPNDPLWVAFANARDALEDKFSVDLTIVARWDWFETEFTDGIDSCLDLEEGVTGEPLYFGWRFVIVSLDGREFEGRTSFNAQIVTACDRVTVPVTTPVDTAVDPNLPAPVAGAGAGGAFELGGHVVGLGPNTVAAMRRSGMTWVKKQFRYSLGMDASAAAGLINDARANGFRIVLGIIGDRAQLGADFDNYINSYAQFVGGVAALGADAIEVWNEPNIDREWPAGQINGANYTRLLAAAFNAIKSSNSSTIVISGAPAPTGFFGAAGCGAGGCNDDVFMQQMAQAGAGQYMDCVGLHYNEGIIAPSARSGDPRGGYPTYYFQSMLGRGLAPFGGLPACFTELGYVTPEGFGTPLPGGFAWGQSTSVAQQAAWLAEAASLSAQSGRVRMLIVWNVDFTSYTADDPQAGYAIIRPDGSCPACGTLGTVMGS